MPPKSAANKSQLEPDEILQAVIIADSFNRRFRPLTLDTPRCLLPLCNVPLIEYTLEFLAISGVQEIFVVCCAHHEQIKDYIRSSKWGKTSLPRVVTIVSQELLSVGDALRSLDGKNILRGDFILVSGDIVSNMKLDKALEEHKARRQIDKNAIMTMVVKQASPTHRSRSKGEEALFVLDPKTNQCLHYEPMEVYPKKNRLNLELKTFKEHPEIQIRNDLIDCQIDICSIEVLLLFTENFDYQHIRKDFVRGILQSDILAKTIHCHIISQSYAARVKSTQMYEAISKDIMSRWTFPMVPDNNLLESHTYSFSRPHIYKEKDVVLSRSASLSEQVVIGSFTEIGDKTQIRNSVVGRGCKISANVVIDGAFIWDNVTIHSGAQICRSIIASDAVIGENAVVNRGSIVSYGVVVGSSQALPNFTKIAHRLPDVDDEEYDSDDNLVSRDPTDHAQPFAAELVGQDGEGYEWKDSYSDEEDEEDFDPRNVELTALGFEPESAEEDEESDDDVSVGEEEAVGPEVNFFDEANATFDRAITDGHDVSTAALELNTLKMAFNSTFHDVREIVTRGIVSQIQPDQPNSSAKKIIAQWGGLLTKYVFSEEDQIDSLDLLLTHCVQFEAQSKGLIFLIRELYEADIIEEDSILAWFTASSKRSGVAAKIRDSVKPFVVWLQEAEEDEDEDDEEDEDEDEDEDDDDDDVDDDDDDGDD
ncbi:nucleotide-diphospho-sugar transferase [Polychytrium aggregatum]|uniref:nucleotide-diphospho-sugar transferase n=1 Tax=Polychytrium aggregatum TaxID=110093 RepID=UPI0022FEB443|nr:nucleotide-diphospho-sugar transferase [Polychytrium aggregatum]KAI9193036.1 nucleotide-diphospho-sugar transferase [Polychytrium aggregatum]